MAYELVTIHPDGPRVRRFDVFDDAAAAAETSTPDHDGSVLPNIPQDVLDTRGEDAYEKGFYWFGNRYAVIFTTTERNPQ